MSTSPVLNEEDVEALYNHFMDEDHDLVEEGIEDYGKYLTIEDIT